MCWQTAAATWQILLLLKKNKNPTASVLGGFPQPHSTLLYFIYLISWSSLIYIHPSALASDLYSRASTRLFQHGLSVIAFLVTKRLTWKWKVRCVFFYKKKWIFHNYLRQKRMSTEISVSDLILWNTRTQKTVQPSAGVSHCRHDWFN